MAHRIVRAAFDRLDAARSEFARTIADLSGRPDFLDALLHEDAPRELAALVLESGAPQTQQLATAALARLAASAASVAGALVATGAVAAVCSRTDVAGAHPAVLAGACAIVRAVASHGGELSEAVLDAGAAGVVVRALGDYDIDARTEAALAASALAGGGALCASRVVAAADGAGAAALLVISLQHRDGGLVRAAASALRALASASLDVASAITSAGAVPRLLGLLACGEPRARARALLALSAVLGHAGDAGREFAEAAVEVTATVSQGACTAEGSPGPATTTTATVNAAATGTTSRRNRAAAVAGRGTLPLLVAAVTDEDASVRRAATACLRAVASHGGALAVAAAAAGALPALVEHAGTGGGVQRLPGAAPWGGADRLPSLMAVGFVAAASPALALEAIRAGALDVLRSVLSPAAVAAARGVEPAFCRAAAVWAVAQLGRHGPEHAALVADAGLLRLVLDASGAETASWDPVAPSVADTARELGARASWKPAALMGSRTRAAAAAAATTSSTSTGLADRGQQRGGSGCDGADVEERLELEDLRDKARRCLLAIVPHVRLVPALQSLLAVAAPADVGLLVLQRLAAALRPAELAAEADCATPAGEGSQAEPDVASTTATRSQADGRAGCRGRNADSADAACVVAADASCLSSEAPHDARDARVMFAASGGVALVQRVGRAWAQRVAEEEAAADGAGAGSADGAGQPATVHSRALSRDTVLAAIAGVNAHFPSELVSFHTPGYATTVLAARLPDGNDSSVAVAH